MTGLSLTIAGASFSTSVGFDPAGDSTITDWYVFGDRTGAGSITSSLTNQASGAKSPTVTGESSITVNQNNIVVNNTKSEIVSNLSGSEDFTVFAVVTPDFFNAASAPTGQGNPVTAGMSGIIPFGNIVGGSTLQGVGVQANAQSSNTFRWEGYSQGVYSGYSTLHQIFTPTAALPIAETPILVALTQTTSTKTLTFYDLTNAPGNALSAGAMGTGYNVADTNLLIGSSYDAQNGNAPCLGAKLSFWAGFQRAMTQSEIQDMATKIRRVLKQNGLIVG
ncbi:hypothetical protein [Acetobacter pasteurianus]|uniref:Uncharacterized protein n=1 Tax=Acetobacter pasteurianus NBRC 3188 TaxID=1226663 RepID=A0A401WUL0_ACEPA|nr:hypothetical protein [Acetobacter pasteurianus]GCD53023.1 hypothetical protein NBRC3188_1720 [Acetobacter pasteurianus NBRC 3188]